VEILEHDERYGFLIIHELGIDNKETIDFLMGFDPE
jgi:hypothetical protein